MSDSTTTTISISMSSNTHPKLIALYRYLTEVWLSFKEVVISGDEDAITTMVSDKYIDGSIGHGVVKAMMLKCREDGFLRHEQIPFPIGFIQVVGEQRIKLKGVGLVEVRSEEGVDLCLNRGELKIKLITIERRFRRFYLNMVLMDGSTLAISV